MEFQISDEYDKLEAVLVHRPGEEVDRLTHENMRSFLFEDIPYLSRMQHEHDAFAGKMREHGIRVIYLEDLLLDVLTTQPQAKQELVEAVCTVEQVPAIAGDLLDEKTVSNADLLGLLFKGLTHDEYHDLTGRGVRSRAAQAQFLLDPIPNAYFSRDPAVVIGNAAISCKMHYLERVRETVLTRIVLEYHPEFAGNPIAYGGSDSPVEDRPFTIEGGDVIVLNEDALLIGASERTRSETIEVLARKVFEMGRIRRVYEIPIPTERTFMHLDTVFTIVDRGAVVWFPQVMDHVGRIDQYQAEDGDMVCTPESRSLLEILSDEFGQGVTVTRTGGGDRHYASREQRTDGTNIFAIAPKVAITYERNERTTAALEQAGIACIRIADSELVRGLGGPRCMTMPLRRTKSQVNDRQTS